MDAEDLEKKLAQKWAEVRPVIITFAGERFVVEYSEYNNFLASPAVAYVHCYLNYDGNLTPLGSPNH